jgi:hypothetical protein
VTSAWQMRNYSDNWAQFSRRNPAAMLVSLAYGYEEYRRDFTEFNLVVLPFLPTHIHASTAC